MGHAGRKRRVKSSAYRERDHAFGKLMLTLRMATGLTQAGLADLLGVSRHAVGGWESGQSYPNRRQVKPSSQASKRREVEGRSVRPAMERPAACLIASQTS